MNIKMDVELKVIREDGKSVTMHTTTNNLKVLMENHEIHGLTEMLNQLIIEINNNETPF
jgi:hypothetical protein